jgi:hypothetical protein
MAIPISNVTRRVVYAASGTGPYAFTFEILANTDIGVYRDDTLLTLTTDYTVTINPNGTGSITLVASPTGATQIAIVGNRTIQRTTDFVTGGDFFANTVNNELDQQTIFAQQNAEGLARSLQAPQTDPTTINMTLPRKDDRAGKYLAFDEDGNPKPGDTAIDVAAVAAVADEVAIVADNIASVNTNAANIVAIQNASANASAAAASASAAAASYDSFDDRYLGVKTTNPTLDNDGNALLTGAIYFNSVASEMRVYTGSTWQVATAAPNAVIEYEFTATAGQTTYSFAGEYNVGFLYVWVNGVLLSDADITATDGTNITFASALLLGDEVRAMTFKALGSVMAETIRFTPSAPLSATNVQSAITEVMQAMYPVGSIYTNATNSTNPSTLFGFGTWVSFGAGRMPVGFNAADPLFDAAEETGGSKDATLVSHNHTGTTGNESANHAHYTSGTTVGAGAHTHDMYIHPSLRSSNCCSYVFPYPQGSGGVGYGDVISTVGNHTHDFGAWSGGVNANHNHSFTTSTNGSSATNANLPPFITVYMWKRTA